VSLRPLTVFVGANGVGKTSLLEAVYAVGLFSRGMVLVYEERHHEGRWNTRDLVNAKATQAEISIFTDGDSSSMRFSRSKEPKFLPATDLQKIESGLGEVSRIRLDPERIAMPSTFTTGIPKLRHDGTGLPTLLQYLHGLRDGTFEAIEEGVRAVVTRFRRVQFRPASIHEVRTEYLTVEGQKVPRVVEQDLAGVELTVEFDDGAIVPATHASEGTVLTLAILAMIHTAHVHKRRTVLIDDLDRALHPAAQHRLVEALYKVLAATPGLQILATTHSPDLVDACAAEDVRVLARDAEGNTAARALSEHPEAEKWLKLLRVGEFWGTVGEDWVTARTPAP